MTNKAQELAAGAKTDLEKIDGGLLLRLQKYPLHGVDAGEGPARL